MILYADDATLISSLSPFNLRTEIETANLELAKVHEWLTLNKLSLNIKKTRYMLFHFPQRQINFTQLPDLQISNVTIERTSEFDFLGLIINENLNWKPHISKICTKLARVTGILKRLQNTLPCFVLRTIYNSLFLPHLNYCILAWGASCSRVIKLQKRAIRYVYKSKYNAHTEPIFKSNTTLKFEDIYTLKSLKFFHKYINNSLPKYFSNMFQPVFNINPYNTRNRNNPLPQIPHKPSCANVVRYIIPRIVASTTNAITDKVYTHSLDGFSTYIKTYIIKTYKYECQIDNCYICDRNSRHTN